MKTEKDINSNSDHSIPSGRAGVGVANAIFPGSFDPFTRGHADIVKRGLQLFDHIVIAVGQNEQKQSWIPVEERVRALRELYRNEPRISVEHYNTLTVDFARKCNARFILRGVRTHKDYEYEMGMADVNRQLAEDIETVVLFSDPSLANISSSVVREVAHFGRDIQQWLPEGLNYKKTL